MVEFEQYSFFSDDAVIIVLISGNKFYLASKIITHSFNQLRLLITIIRCVSITSIQIANTQKF